MSVKGRSKGENDIGQSRLLKFLTSFLELIGVGVVVPAVRSFKKRITRVLDSIPVGVGVGVGGERGRERVERE